MIDMDYIDYCFRREAEEKQRRAGKDVVTPEWMAAQQVKALADGGTEAGLIVDLVDRATGDVDT